MPQNQKMKKILFLVVWSFALIYCKKNNQGDNQKASEINKDLIISCEGIGKLKFSMTYDDILNTFGKENVKSDTFIYDKNSELAMMSLDTVDRISTVISAPEGKIYVSWLPGLKTSKIESMSLNFYDHPKYQFTNGIKAGSTMEEFIKANGNEEFEFYGFGWQFGGLLLENSKGKIFQDYPCIGGLTHFRPVNDNYGNVQNLLGDQKYKSKDVKPEQAKKIILSEITILNK